MKAIDLLRLAYSECACLDGLTWLYVWIEKHPNGTASEFFKEKAKQEIFSNGQFPCLEKIDKIREICSDIKIERDLLPCLMMRVNYPDNKMSTDCFFDWSLSHLLDWSKFTSHGKINIYYSLITVKKRGLYLADMFEDEQ